MAHVQAFVCVCANGACTCALPCVRARPEIFHSARAWFRRIRASLRSAFFASSGHAKVGARKVQDKRLVVKGAPTALARSGQT
eukprot:5949632-Pleurochrysis_carterae.AAC.1